MSGHPEDWDMSSAARRREGFFGPSTLTTGTSRLSEPPQVTTLPERPHRRSTPHPKAGTSGIVTQEWGDDASKTADTPRRRTSADVSNGRLSRTSNDQAESIRSHMVRSLSREEIQPGGDQSLTKSEGKRPAIPSEPRMPRAGGGGSIGSERRVGFRPYDDVNYRARRGSESSPESALNMAHVQSQRKDGDGVVEGAQFGGSPDSRPRYAQPRTHHTHQERKTETDGYEERSGLGEARRKAEERPQNNPRRRDNHGSGWSEEVGEPERRRHDRVGSGASRDKRSQEYSDEENRRETGSYRRDTSSGSRSRREHRRPRPPKKVGTIEKVFKGIDRFLS